MIAEIFETKLGKDCSKSFIEIQKILELTWYHNNHHNTDEFLVWVEHLFFFANNPFLTLAPKIV